MNKLISTAVIAFAFGSTAAFAHHPAADIVDAEIYAMIDENVSETPHADLTVDDMGADAAADTGSAMDTVSAEVDAMADVAEVQERGAMGPQR